MTFPITVPRLGWSMDEGTFVGWLRKDGESVKAGEPLFTLEGDKATQEVEATDSGILRVSPEAPKAGSPVSVGAVLGYLVSENESILPAESESVRKPVGRGVLTAPDEPAQERPCAGAVRTPPPTQNKAEPAQPLLIVPISPRARRLAAELGVDYSRLKGSGRNGRVIEADVLAAAQKHPMS